MNTNKETYVRLTKKTKVMLNISLEKTMAILASEHFSIYGNLEDIDILETDAYVATLTKVAPFLLFPPNITVPTFHQFYLTFLCDLCKTTGAEINRTFLHMLVVKAAHICPGLIEKIDRCANNTNQICIEYTTDSETVFLKALRCVFEHPDNPKKILELANRTRIYDVKKIATDICMAIHGLEWLIPGSVDTFIEQHQDTYSIYW